MALREIPLTSLYPAYQQRVDLEAATYVIGLRFNERANLWFLDIMDADGNPIVMGTPLQSNLDLIKRFKDVRLPGGRFTAVDSSGQNQDATVETLGEVVRLLYDEAS